MANINVDITTTLLGDTDTPNSYVGEGGKFLAVKADESGTEFKSVSSDLTIDTTPITGGSTGYPLYHKSGNVVGEFTGAYFDTVNNRVGIRTTTPNASVDIVAPGSLSTDYALLVRNSYSTTKFLEISGNGNYYLSSNGSTLTDAFSRISDGRMFMAKSGGNFIELNPSAPNRFYFPSNGLQITSGSNTTVIDTTNAGFYFYTGTLQIGSGLVATGGASMAIWLENGTAPSTNYVDRHWYYSADQTPGNAAPHFRTENGAVVRLYKQPKPTTLAGVITLLTNLGLC